MLPNVGAHCKWGLLILDTVDQLFQNVAVQTIDGLALGKVFLWEAVKRLHF